MTIQHNKQNKLSLHPFYVQNLQRVYNKQITALHTHVQYRHYTIKQIQILTNKLDTNTSHTSKHVQNFSEGYIPVLIVALGGLHQQIAGLPAE